MMNDKEARTISKALDMIESALDLMVDNNNLLKTLNNMTELNLEANKILIDELRKFRDDNDHYLL